MRKHTGTGLAATISGKYYLIDHKILFFCGYFFYLFTPYLLGSIHAFEQYPGVSLYLQFFDRIPQQRINAYLIITLSWLPAFYLGHLLFRFLLPRKHPLHLYEPDFVTRSIPYLSILLFAALIVFVYMSRSFIFGSFDRSDVARMGKLSTLMIVYDFFLAYQLVTRQRISILLLAGILLTAAMLVIAGGRLTVLQSFLIFLIFKTSFATRPWKFGRIIWFGCIAFLTGSFIGIWRVGAGFSVEKAWFSLMAEPLFTWFSTGSFLASNDIPLLGMPVNFFTSFFNLIPNTIIDSSSFVVSTRQMGFSYSNPFGADSIWTTLIINFGAIGSFVFVFITGFMLAFLRHLSESSRFAAAYYILVCAMLPFEFFRTGFYILNKQLFFNFLLIPFILITLLRLFEYLQSAKPGKASPVTH
jgi:hypothetical protein